MLKKHKAFTLVELLAVLAILAIIALITVPRILQMVEDSRKSSIDSVIKSVEKAASLYASSLELESEGTLPVTITFENGVSYYQFSGGTKTKGNLLDLKGKIPENGKVIINTDKSYEYQVYNPYDKMCVKNDVTNYLTLSNQVITVTDFKNETNRCISVGTLNVSNLTVDDQMQVDYDILYKDVALDEVAAETDKVTAGMNFQGSGNVTSWSPGIGFKNTKLTGSGAYHFSYVQKLTPAQKENASFKMNMRFDHFTEGTVEISNIKVTKKGAKISTNGKCF